MTSEFESIEFSNAPEQKSISIDAKIYDQIEMVRLLLEQSGMNESDLLLEFGMTELSVDSIAETAIKEFLAGVSESLSKGD